MIDIIIIGAGPAGFTAAVYAARSGMTVTLLEKGFYGGQTAPLQKIDNYPGMPSVSGFELVQNMKKQAEQFGVKIEKGEVTSLKATEGGYIVTTPTAEYIGKTVIIATGTFWRRLGIEGEKTFIGRGVSYCATCDGFFYKDKEVAVVGGGKEALDSAMYLSGVCSKVFLVHRRSEFFEPENGVAALKTAGNIDMLTPFSAEKIYGDEKAEGLEIKNISTGEMTRLNVSGVFVAVGTSPDSGVFAAAGVKTEGGFIITDDNMATSLAGVFAAGDVRKKRTKQIITAAADGAEAAISAKNYIKGLR